ISRRRIHGRSGERPPGARQRHGGLTQGGAHPAIEPSARRIVSGRPAVRGRRRRNRRRAEGELTMATYSAAVLDDIRAGVDIVDFIGRFVNLRKAGANWKGLCPFHGEKTPSFMVNPKRGIFHCFGCGVGGDIFGFLMRQDRLSFPDAVRALANTAGGPLPEERGAQPGDSGREELFRVMDLAARFYAETLWNPAGERAQKYLAERGIEPEVAKRFGLGYAPDGWDRLADFMKSERISEETLVAAGLAGAPAEPGGAGDPPRRTPRVSMCGLPQPQVPP